MEHVATDEDDTPPTHPTDTVKWRAARKLFTRGLITQAEAARLIGISRQLAEWHLRRLRFDWHIARRAHVERLWQAALAQEDEQA